MNHTARSPYPPRAPRGAGVLRLRPIPLALALLAGGLATPASALDYSWLGGAGSWSDSSKWSLHGVPGSGDGATLDSGAISQDNSISLNSLVLNGGITALGGSGSTQTGSFVFTGGNLGLVGTSGGATSVAGAAHLDGARDLWVHYGHTLNLLGSTIWGTGNGRIFVDDASLHIGAGATFTDLGAGAANQSKSLGSSSRGAVNNAGTYVRSGLGTTSAVNFNNTGTLTINEGTFAVNDTFSNTGAVTLAAGAALHGTERTFANAGTLSGFGTVITRGENHALDNAGTIDPGSAAAMGTLTINGDLLMADASVLRIDLGGSGVSDKLAITGDLTLSGELAIWGPTATVLQVGEVYTIASFAQRLGNTGFDEISWHGLNSTDFAVTYTANSIELRVVAVPEPTTYALMLGGLAVLGFAARRRRSA